MDDEARYFLKRIGMKLIIVLATLGISTTAALAINDERPVIFDVEAERRQCPDLPEINTKHAALLVLASI